MVYNFTYDTRELKAIVAEVRGLKSSIVRLGAASPRRDFSEKVAALSDVAARCAEICTYFSTSAAKINLRESAAHAVETLQQSRILLATLGGAHPTGWSSLPTFFSSYKSNYAGAYLTERETAHFFRKTDMQSQADPVSYIVVVDAPSGIRVALSTRFCSPSDIDEEALTWDESFEIFERLSLGEKA